jgi:hypothetical protein
MAVTVIGFAVVMVLLAIATALVFVDLAHEVSLRQAHQAYRKQLAADLALDRLVHDRNFTGRLPEEANDDIAAAFGGDNAFYPVFDGEATSMGPWRHYLKPPVAMRVRTRSVGRASG